MNSVDAQQIPHFQNGEYTWNYQLTTRPNLFLYFGKLQNERIGFWKNKKVVKVHNNSPKPHKKRREKFGIWMSYGHAKSEWPWNRTKTKKKKDGNHKHWEIAVTFPLVEKYAFKIQPEMRTSFC
ncbi:hypothetical protein CEXT_49931 [Caerostris extrusa]|uniref:Uncharacterized protein n=1 Tax=Caerostris extrusa TaxID=172846 RepID=A0AAV4QJH5_CAEEX|nr:hypothetical protein CEXT_49931 [Caerostris extrusa]